MKAPQKVRMLSAESQKFVAGEIHGPVNKEPQELSQILIAVQKFHQHQQEHKLRTVSQRESPRKEQHLMPHRILLVSLVQRENPVLAPDKVMNLRHHIRRHIGQHIILLPDVHHQPDHKGRNERIKRSDYRKAQNSYTFFHSPNFRGFHNRNCHNRDCHKQVFHKMKDTKYHISCPSYEKYSKKLQ